MSDLKKLLGSKRTPILGVVRKIKILENMKNQIEFTRIDNDYNGNPRYVCHFLNIANDYDEALKIAKTIGGKKFHGGGIVFQSYNIRHIAKRILKMKNDVQ